MGSFIARKWRKSLLIILPMLMSFLSGAAHAQQTPNFSYRSVDTTLLVSGKYCSYGRASKLSIPNNIQSYIQNYVYQNESEFHEQIRSIKYGMAGRRLVHAQLSLLYRFDVNKLNIDYQYEGNDVCGRYDMALPLDFKQDYTYYLPTNPTDKFYLLTLPNINVIHEIKQRYPTLTNVPATKIKLFINEIAKINDSTLLIEFDFSELKRQTTTDKKKVYIAGTEQFLPGLRDYLIKSGFQIVNQIERSFWQIDIKQTHYPHFDVIIDGQNEDSVTIKSESFPLPPFPTATEIQRKKLLEFQLTMMKLDKKLD